MCGFVIIWRPDGVHEAELAHALNLISSRGPDATGMDIFLDKKLAFGHQRLSILDLSSAADQPMEDARGRGAIVYNGEIVNYRDARSSMRGVTWRSDCDTEVLLESFLERGNQALDDFVGMFAFGIFDARVGVLHLARDRFGIKPLYWTRLSDGGFAAASEIPPLLALRGGSPSADLGTIFSYLESGIYDACESTFFDGIFSLSPGHHGILDLASGKFSSSRWYDFCSRVGKDDYQRSVSDWQDEITFRIENAVHDHLVSDVPVGLNVSGGVDSSLLCSLVSDKISDLHVFSQDFEHPYSEIEFVKQAIGSASLHVSVLRSKNILESLDKTVSRQAEPFGGVFVIGYDYLYRSADAAGVKVLLDGNGVDEVFLGYGKYRSFLSRDLDANASVSIDGTRSTLPEAISLNLRGYGKPYLVPEYSGFFKEPVRAAAARDLLHLKIPRGLRFNDRMSMMHAKELRVPFLDHRLVECAFRAPIDLFLRNNTTKDLFRQIACARIGTELAFAPKREVQSPQREWLAAQWSDLVKRILWSESFADRGWIDPSVARRLYSDYQDGPQLNSFAIWQWLNLELWARKYLD